MIKVLDIGYDRKIFEPGSAAESKVIEQGALFEELHLIVFSRKSHGLKIKQISHNVWAYPTNSVSKWLYVRDGGKLGKKIVLDRKFVRGLSVITAQDPFESGLTGLHVKKRWRLPLQVQLHTDPFSYNFSGFINILRKHIMKKVIRQADAVRVVTEGLKAIVLKKFSARPDRIDVLPIYIDKKKIESGAITFDLHAKYGWNFILLTVARLTKEKNIPLALDIFDRVREYFPASGFVIVGDGPESDDLKRKAHDLGILSSVAFVGWQENLASYYRTADLYLQTSLYEGYGMSMIEAGLSGMPVVTTPVGIANDLKNGVDLIVCPQGDTDYMFKSVYDLVSNVQKREDLGRSITRSLEEKLIPKEEYLKRYQDMLEAISKLVEAK